MAQPPKKNAEETRRRAENSKQDKNHEIELHDEEIKPATWRPFPGPPGSTALLRVALTREACSQLVAHAHESLEVEVCGVLVGEIGEDQDGVFADVRATVRGVATRQASTHVTFTHETWNSIHRKMEEEHPDLQIVGWYHTHPGLGVEFSDMDIFVQKNFFAGPGQVALLMDPLGGDVALGVSGDEGIQYIDHFWVDGREKRCVVPGNRVPWSASAGGEKAAAPAETLEAVEVRLSQLTKAVDDLRLGMYRTITGLAMFIGLGVMALIGYEIYSAYARPLTPPEPLQYGSFPIKIGDKVYLVGVALVGWPVPQTFLRNLHELKENPPGISPEGQRQTAPMGTPEQTGAPSPPPNSQKPGGPAVEPTPPKHESKNDTPK